MDRAEVPEVGCLRGGAPGLTGPSLLKMGQTLAVVPPFLELEGVLEVIQSNPLLCAPSLKDSVSFVGMIWGLKPMRARAESDQGGATWPSIQLPTHTVMPLGLP